MRLSTRSIYFLALCFFVVTYVPHASELPAEQTGDQSGAEPVTQATTTEPLVCDGLPYVENGIAMVPARPVCDFLRAKLTVNDGLLTVVKTFGEPNLARTVTIRIGGKSAQIWDGGSSRTVALAKVTESRLGTVFVPAKFWVEILGGELISDRSFKPLSIKDEGRVGQFVSKNDAPYAGTGAARVTISNRVGRALSLRLNGPQKLRVEIGNNSKISLRLKPGLYYYQAGSNGMQTLKSARRLLAGRQTTWVWGKN